VGGLELGLEAREDRGEAIAVARKRGLVVCNGLLDEDVGACG